MSPRFAWPIRTAFLGWVLLVFAGTHWPQLRIDGPVQRTDLWIHLFAYGVWGFLATLSCWFGPAGSPRNLGLSLALTCVAAVIDEATQAIPGLHRTVAASDAIANIAGGCLGVLIASFLSTRVPQPNQR